MRNIQDYKPYKGFYDLREFNLNKRDFIKAWGLQEVIYLANKKKEYYKKYDPLMWQKALDYSARLNYYLNSSLIKKT
jgi:hypothetical protein